MEEKRELTLEEMAKVFGGAQWPFRNMISEKTNVCPLCGQETMLLFDEKAGICQSCQLKMSKQQ